MMITVLTSTSNSPLDVSRMPGSNTGNLSETLVCFARKLLGAPSAGDTLITVTLGDSNDINDLVLLEDGGDWDFLLEQTLGEVDLLIKRASVDLDLHKVSLLLFEWGDSDLRVGENTDDGAVFLDTSKLAGDRGARSFGVLLGVLGESLLLALVPVLVESSLNLLAQVLGPNGGKRSKTTRSLDVTDNTDNDHL
jgi:hypothetical protein